jgi:hypothetical protein
LKAVIFTTGALAAGVLTIAIALAPVIGVAAVGVAWFVAQTVVASALLLGELRTVWLPYVHTDRLRALSSRKRAARQRRGASAATLALESSGLGREGWEIVEAIADTDAVSSVVVHTPERPADALLKVATTP